MSISYPLAYPSSPGWMTAKFRPRTVVGMTSSVFTLSQQTFEWDGDSWEVDLELPPMSRSDAAAWIAWLAALRGRLGSFMLGPAGAERTARGTASGVTVNGGGQSGKTLALSGSGTLKAGDYIQAGTASVQRLYMNLTDLTLAGTADIFPRLRESPTNGTSVTIASPKGLFMLSDIPEWDIDRAQIYGISFKAVEDLRGL